LPKNPGCQGKALATSPFCCCEIGWLQNNQSFVAVAVRGGVKKLKPVLFKSAEHTSMESDNINHYQIQIFESGGAIAMSGILRKGTLSQGKGDVLLPK
jgi:hypothetical protein